MTRALTRPTTSATSTRACSRVERTAAFDLLDAHLRDPATIVRGMDVAGRLLGAGLLDLDPRVSHQWPLGRIDEIFATAMAEPEGFVKAVVATTDETAPASGAEP